MTPTKQTVYIPIKEHSVFKILEGGTTLQNCYPQEGYFFTPEELNNYIAMVGKQFLDAASKTKITGDYSVNLYERNGDDKQSITNTFEETFKKFEA